MRKYLIELISLSSPRSRLTFWFIITALILILPYDFFANLSLWQKIGWEGAPSIGLTRSYWLILRGDFVGAWELNKLIYLVLVVGFIILASDTSKIIRLLLVSKRKQ